MRPPALFELSPRVTGLRTLMVNVYLVACPPPSEDWVLVDAGVRGFASRIQTEATRHFGPGRPPLAVILTHGHFDHTGSLPALLREWKTPIYAHVDELPHLNERLPYPPADPGVGGGWIAKSSGLFPRQSTLLPAPVRPLPADGSVPGLPDWIWVPTPGHSPGQVALWHESDRVLLSADALISTRQESARAVWRQQLEVRPPPAYFTCDWTKAYLSLRRLQALDARTVGTGHGQPLRGGAWQRELDALLADFPHRGLPQHGHYARTTWTEPVPV